MERATPVKGARMSDLDSSKIYGFSVLDIETWEDGEWFVMGRREKDELIEALRIRWV